MQAYCTFHIVQKIAFFWFWCGFYALCVALCRNSENFNLRQIISIVSVWTWIKSWPFLMVQWGHLGKWADGSAAASAQEWLNKSDFAQAVVPASHRALGLGENLNVWWSVCPEGPCDQWALSQPQPAQQKCMKRLPQFFPVWVFLSPSRVRHCFKALSVEWQWLNCWQHSVQSCSRGAALV